MSRQLIDALKSAMKPAPKPRGHRVQPAREHRDEDPIIAQRDVDTRGVRTIGGVRVTINISDRPNY